MSSEHSSTFAPNCLDVESFLMGPIWSSDDANATNPYLETNP